MAPEEEVLRKILHMPRDYRGADLSPIALVTRSGYMGLTNPLSVEAIAGALQVHPEFVDDWLMFSENKRSSGWYILERSSGYEVATRPIDEKTFFLISDRFEACARYIKEQVESIANHIREDVDTRSAPDEERPQ